MSIVLKTAMPAKPCQFFNPLQSVSTTPLSDTPNYVLRLPLHIVMAASKGVMLHTKHRLSVASNATLDDNVISFTGGGNVALCKILEPLSPILNYFEIEILNQGLSACIGIGVGSLQYSVHSQPGWRRHSIGYHADDGRLYHEKGHGRQFGPKCTTGDVMGCGIDFDSDEVDTRFVRVFFTKNGRQVGEMQRMKRPVKGFYPLIGLHSNREKVAYLGHWRRVPETLSEPMELGNSPFDKWLRSNGVKFVDSSCQLEYAGLGDAPPDVAIAQANFPINQHNHYFELEILEGGDKCAVAIGLGKITYPLHRHPGWDAGGVGYHADDGKLFTGHGIGKAFGPTCSTGDRMGCGVRFSKEGEADWDIITESGSDSDRADVQEEVEMDDDDLLDYGDDDDEDDYSDYSDYSIESPPPPRLGRDPSRQKSRPHSPGQRQWTVYFTKNGDLVGETECTVPSGGFYPLVAMLSQGEKILVDFEPLSG